MCTAMFVMACMDALSKQLASTYPISQILAVRFWMFTAFAVLILSRGRLLAALRTSHPWLQLSRGLVITLEVAVFVLAFRHLPLADVHAIGGVAPLLVTALAAPVLGERIGLHRWCAVGVGFNAEPRTWALGSGGTGAFTPDSERPLRPCNHRANCTSKARGNVESP